MSVEHLQETERLQMQNKEFKGRSLATWCVETFSSKSCWQYTQTASVLVNTAKEIAHLTPIPWMTVVPGWVSSILHLCLEEKGYGQGLRRTPGVGGSSICSAHTLKVREIPMFPQPLQEAEKAVIVRIFGLKILGWFWWCLFSVAILRPTLLNSSHALRVSKTFVYILKERFRFWDKGNQAIPKYLQNLKLSDMPYTNQRCRERNIRAGISTVWSLLMILGHAVFVVVLFFSWVLLSYIKVRYCMLKTSCTMLKYWIFLFL